MIEPSPDIDRLASFLASLETARRLLVSYPPGHPVLNTALERARTEGNELLARSSPLTIGVSRGTLLLAGEELKLRSPRISSFARLLYDRDVAAVTFHAGLTVADIFGLSRLLSEKEQVLRTQGGIGHLLAEITERIRITEMDYRAFIAIEGLEDGGQKERSLWELFIKTLVTEIDGGETTGRPGIDFDDVERICSLVEENRDPTALVRLIENYSRSLVTFSRIPPHQGLSRLLRRIGHLIQQLPEELRSRFFSSSVDTLSDTPRLLEEILRGMDSPFLLSLLEELGRRRGSLPPLVVGLVSRLGTAAEQPFPHALMVEQETSERLHELFREDDLDAFIPESYRTSLTAIIEGKTPIEPVSSPELDQLTETLSPHHLEQKTGEIVMELFRIGGDDELVPSLTRTLCDTIRYHVDTGDLEKGLSIVETLATKLVSLPCSKEVMDGIDAFLSSDEFINEILQGLTLWGKPKYGVIASFIRRGGDAYVKPLLERLATEENMSLRRYCIERLVELHPSVDRLTPYLEDGRWYVVRNMLILLRSIGDASVCRRLYRLTRHPHARVRQEAVRTLAHFGDREADRIILSLLRQPDEASITSALQLTGKGAGPEVVSAVLGLLDRGSLTNYEYRIKSAAVQTLAEIGNPMVLHRLEKILFSSTLIHASHHNRLKGDIIRSLPLYPPQSVLPLFREIASRGSKEMIEIAEESYRHLQRRSQGGQDAADR